MNLYVFHSPVVRQRAAALALAALLLFMLYLLHPLRHPSLSGNTLVVFWGLSIYFMGMLGICGFIWWSARDLPAKTLPDSAQWVGPNHIPPRTRIFYIIGACLLLAYATHGLMINDLYIPGKRSRGVHLIGVEAWLMAGAFACTSANLLAVVVDH